MAAVMLNEFQNSFSVSGLERSQGLIRFRFQSEISRNGFGHLVTDKLNQDKARSARQHFRRQSKVLCGNWSSPASGEELVGLIDAIGLEVPEISLVQFVQVLAQEDLK